MDIKLKHRLVGACVILALAVFFLPMVLDSEKYRSDIDSKIPTDSTLKETPANSEDPLSPEPENVTEERGALTINLDEDEPGKAIQESSAEDNVTAEVEQGKKADGAKIDENNGQSETLNKQEKVQDSAESLHNSTRSTQSTDRSNDVANNESQQNNHESAEPISNSEEESQAPKESTDKEDAQSEPVNAATAAAEEPTKPVFKEQPWVIQIGSFSNKKNASGLVSDLRNQGYRAYERDSGDYSRVYVGPYPDKKAAEKRQPKLEEIIGTSIKIIEFDAQAH